MGRWRGNKRRVVYKKEGSKSSSTVGATDADSSNSNSNSNNSNVVWSWKEQKEVIQYLTEYRQAAERVYQQEYDTDDIHLSTTTATVSSDQAPVVIGGMVFPALTDAAVSQAYLTLSKALSSKRRRAIHEFCVEVGLYHGSVGLTRDDRTLILTIYADGFQHAVGLEQPAHADMRMERYRPWYCWHQNQNQNNNNNKGSGQQRDLTPTRSNSSTSIHVLQQLPMDMDNETVARQRIDQLIDQPGDCLRDDRDVLDFIALESDDLSTIAPPGPDATDHDENHNHNNQNNGNHNHDHWMLVDTADKMKQCIAELVESSPSEIAFDVESYNKSKYTQLTCLLQVTSDAGKEYVIDTLADGVWDQVGGLAPLFSDPRIVKIGHSIGGLDVRSLHRDFGIFIVNAFDTYESAKILGLKAHGLAKVCEHYGITEGETYVRLKAVYQASDWRIRPLTAPMIQYGRYDIHYLVKLRKLMMRDLTRSELWDKDATEKDAEGRLVANSLAATLLRIDQLEDEGPAVVKEDDCGDDDDEDDFKSTTGEEARVDSISNELYSTPQGSTRSFDFETETNENDDISRVGVKVVGTKELRIQPRVSTLSLEDSETEITENDDISRVGVNVVGAKELRMQARLMRVISRSQDRCKDLWSNRAEPHLKNSVFQSMVTRGKKREIDWTAANIQLYDDLVQWRDRVAVSLECLPGFVAPLELLVQVAYKRPTTEYSLRKITHFLPEVLEDATSEYREELLTIVRESLETHGIDPDADVVYLYADRKARIKRDVEVAAPKTQIAWKVAVAVAISAVVAVAVMATKRRRTR
jgi:ribonuclease D